MTKDRLETCSDSIFAIVLTLLVLDLRVPLAHGPAGLVQIAPSLLVHAATFLLVGVFWMLHRHPSIDNALGQALRPDQTHIRSPIR